MIDFTKPVQTRDGKPARILCINRKHPSFPVVAAVLGKDCENIEAFTSKGHYWAGESGHTCDLINVPEKVVLYQGVYLSLSYGPAVSRAKHALKEDIPRDDLLAILKVTYVDGKAVKVELA